MVSSGFVVLRVFKEGRAFLQQVLVRPLKRLCIGGRPPAGLFFSPPGSKNGDVLMKRGISFQEKIFSTVVPNLTVQ